MNLTFTLTKRKAAYKEIAEYIQKEIDEGNIKPNEKLPSKRQLAESLNVSVNTIMNAYFELIDSDYIYTIEKKGYYVNELNRKKPPLIINKNKTISDVIYDFTTSSIDPNLFPKTLWKRLYKETFLRNDFLAKSPSNGLDELKHAISRHLVYNKGIHVDPNQIIIGSGIEYLMQQLIPLLNIKTFGVENPGYPKIVTIVKNHNLNIKYLDVDNEGVIPKSSVDIIYTTPFNQFPLGIKMSLNRKKELLNFLSNENKYIIEDDFDSDFRFNTTPSPSLFSLNNNKVIFVSSFSRTISSSLRISYMILPKELLKIYNNTYKNYSSTVPTLEQMVLTKFIMDEHYQVHINKLKRIYKQRRKIIEQYLQENPNFKILSKDNYLYLLVETNKPMINNPKLKINTLSDYEKDLKGKNILLLGYSNLQNDKIIEALNFLSSCLKNE